MIATPDHKSALAALAEERNAAQAAQEALHAAVRSLDKACRACCRSHKPRELTLAMEQAETALMWFERHMYYETGQEQKPLYLRDEQPEIDLESYDRAEIELLTKEERVGMFGRDPLEDQQLHEAAPKEPQCQHVWRWSDYRDSDVCKKCDEVRWIGRK